MIHRCSLLTQFQSDKYPSVHYCPSLTPIDTTTAPVPGLLIPYSSSLPLYQSYWYTTVHYCLSTDPTDTLQTTAATVPVLLIQHSPSTTAQVWAVLLPYSQLLPQYQYYWYDIVLFYLSTSPSGMMSTIAPVSVLLIAYSLLLSQYLSCWYPTVHYCPSTSSTDTL